MVIVLIGFILQMRTRKLREVLSLAQVPGQEGQHQEAGLRT